MPLKGDRWEDRPRDVKTTRVSQLDTELRGLFKKYIGTRRWTYREEVVRLYDLKKWEKHGQG